MHSNRCKLILHCSTGKFCNTILQGNICKRCKSCNAILHCNISKWSNGEITDILTHPSSLNREGAATAMAKEVRV